MVPKVELELATYWLQCTTNCARSAHAFTLHVNVNMATSTF